MVSRSPESVRRSCAGLVARASAISRRSSSRAAALGRGISRRSASSFSWGYRAAGSTIGLLSGEKLEEKHPELVDRRFAIVTRSPRSCSGLGMVGCQEIVTRSRARGFIVCIEQLRDAEIQQFDVTVGGNEDVGRLEIAMDDQVGVCGVDSCGHLQGQD